jgi:hypothetical protein
MKRKILSVLLALAASAAVFTGCSSKKGSSSPAAQGTTAASASAGETPSADDGDEMSESMELMHIKYKDVESLSSGPVIKLSDTTAKPGEMAEVTVSVEGAADQWSMCGIHITYPDVLECKIEDPTDLTAAYTPGAAISKNSGFIAMDWQKNLDPELVREKKHSIFFTTMFVDNAGGDGDIATFYLKVPDDAQPGTVYDLGFYYKDSDMFRNASNDPPFEKYAFEHFQNGSITIR